MNEQHGNLHRLHDAVTRPSIVEGLARAYKAACESGREALGRYWNAYYRLLGSVADAERRGLAYQHVERYVFGLPRGETRRAVLRPYSQRPVRRHRMGVSVQVSNPAEGIRVD